MKIGYCGGCADGRQGQGDHMHEYIGFTGGVAIVWTIDGTTYTDMVEAQEYLTETYGVDTLEAFQFLNKMKKVYN